MRRNLHKDFATILVLLASVAASGEVHYVDWHSSNPTPPYLDWSTAATNIQDAVDASSAGDIVLVTNGTYQNGGAVAIGTLSNRVAITQPITLTSVNGPKATFIFGEHSVFNGPQVRCLYLAGGASASGFTLSAGGSASSPTAVSDSQGGGIWCESTDAVVSNCIAFNNWAAEGGGAFGGTVVDCIFSNNSNGGAYDATLINCLVGGNSGPGAAYCTLYNCSIVGNDNEWNTNAGGTIYCSATNCIIYNNNQQPRSSSNCFATVMSYCCTWPLPPSGTGNFTNAPMFVSDYTNLHLQSSSPCINAGNNQYTTAGTDLDGNPRIVGGTVDVGAYEFQNPRSIISYAWLQQYGLRTDGSADFSDPDHDAMNNWQEWICGTNPTNAASVLRLLSPTNSISGVTVTWQSVTNRSYFIERTSDLGGQFPFIPVISNIAGQQGVTAFTDTNAGGSGPFFYRVGVQQ